jgi:hypothetical protein
MLRISRQYTVPVQKRYRVRERVAEVDLGETFNGTVWCMRSENAGWDSPGWMKTMPVVVGLEVPIPA